ncbi:uncharacterized protein LOC143052931 [Mytilus galloprovincialis]|uniref:uncharacterized protein LOC143052931 n=1 Tax=Mytilus galloprovincialis TaxID=29158 RepID=UPI003F7C84F3
MKCLLPLLILINCLITQGVLEWTVVEKITEYGQNVTLFCNVLNCCPKYSGWDRWTTVQQTLFIDVKTKISNKKYDGKVIKDGYTLVIKNLTKNDLNVSYSCVYGATIGERKILLEEDVFTSISTTQSNVPTGTSKLSEIEIAALITGAIVLLSVSVVVAIYFWKRRIKRNTSEEREENLELTEKLVKTYKNHHVPKNIRDQLQERIADWKKKDKMFVSTRASQYVIKCLQNNSCLTVTGPSGVGKTFISRHVALLFQKKGFKIIPVYSPIDIRDYYQPGKQTVFIVDDICGNFTANQQQIENWKQLLPVINTIIADKCCKIIVSCRLQVYKDDKFNILSPFKSCECNLVSDDLCLTSNEKKNIAKIYTATSMQYIDVVSFNTDFFPLLCSLYHKNRNVDIKEFFKSPFGFYRSELDTLSEHGDEGNYKICGLALCVLFNNQLNEKWFEGKVTDAQ